MSFSNSRHDKSSNPDPCSCNLRSKEKLGANRAIWISVSGRSIIERSKMCSVLNRNSASNDSAWGTCPEMKRALLSLLRLSRRSTKASTDFAATQGEWLRPNEAAERLDFFPARSAWTYFKRLWTFGLLERRSSGRGTLEYKISEQGTARLRWLRSQHS